MGIKGKSGEDLWIVRNGGIMEEETYPFVMRQLPYDYYALAPCISAETLLYHHDRIYKKYVDRLNQALADYPNLQKKSLKELLQEPENLPELLKKPIKEFGGGAYCHELYFDSMLPLVYEQDPRGAFLEAVIRDFGTARDMKERIKKAALKHVGSGFVWLLLGMDGRMKLEVTANRDYPNLKASIPLLNLDIWEHAYYLQFQDRLEEHLNAWIRLINWRKVARRYEEGMDEVEKKALLYGGGNVIIHFRQDDLYETGAGSEHKESRGQGTGDWEEKGGSKEGFRACAEVKNYVVESAGACAEEKEFVGGSAGVLTERNYAGKNTESWEESESTEHSLDGREEKKYAEEAHETWIGEQECRPEGSETWLGEQEYGTEGSEAWVGEQDYVTESLKLQEAMQGRTDVSPDIRMNEEENEFVFIP